VIVRLTAAAAALALTTWLFHSTGLSHPTTAALAYLLVVLVTAATSPLWIALVVSAAATIAFNFFFLPPIGALSITDPENWAAFVAFVVVSVVAGNLSHVARERAREALRRRDELRRLFDLSRDVLLTESGEAVNHLARQIALRFDLEGAALCLPSPDGWRIHHGGARVLSFDSSALDAVGSSSEHARRPDGTTIVPVRFGQRPVGVLALSAPLDPETLDALSGLAALAVERFSLLGEREAAARARERAELSDALLASFSHDLRTPLTAIELASANLLDSLSADARHEQAELITTEVSRLERLFQNITDMARIDADLVAADRKWVEPSEIVEAATMRVDRALRGRPLAITTEPGLVFVDPRLTAAALGHLLENASQCSPPEKEIAVLARCLFGDGMFVLSVRDKGQGLPKQEGGRVFERFFRGPDARRRRASGTGMGLSIAQGLIAAQGGTIGAENHPGGGAEFSIRIPADMRPATEAAGVRNHGAAP
jgi:two-component system sensor histidine kinase KdpD